MLNYTWRNLFGPRRSVRKNRPVSATPRLEVLEDRCLPSGAAPTISHMSNNNWTQGLTSFNGAMTISGGTAPFTLVSDGNLPAGVTPVISGDMIRFRAHPASPGTTAIAP